MPPVVPENAAIVRSESATVPKIYAMSGFRVLERRTVHSSGRVRQSRICLAGAGVVAGHCATAGDRRVGSVPLPFRELIELHHFQFDGRMEGLLQTVHQGVAVEARHLAAGQD